MEKRRTVIQNLFISLAVLMILAFAKENVQASTAANRVPLITYTLSGTVYTYGAPGNSRSTGYILSGDRCTVLELRADGWCKIRYPVSRGTKDAFCRTNQILCNPDFANNTMKLGRNMTVYTRSGLTSRLGTAYGSDNVVIVGNNGRNTQIIYPISGGYKAGWISGIYQNQGEDVLSAADIKKITFDPVFYANKYADLYNAYGYDESKLYYHWTTWGIREGRGASPILDLTHYINSNSDLKNAYGTNYSAAYQHFIKWGYKEGRDSSVYYHGRYYLNRYSDLRNQTYLGLIVHYLNWGIREGRLANSYEMKPNMDRRADAKPNNESEIVSPVPAGCKFSQKSWDGNWFGCHDINRNVSSSTPVYALTDGTVTYKQAYRTYNGVKYLTSYGNYIEFTSSSRIYTAKYCHLNRFEGVNQIISSSRTKQVSGGTSLSLGSRNVKKGEILGYIGTTGNSSGLHLHFELRKNGTRIEPTSVISGLL